MEYVIVALSAIIIALLVVLLLRQNNNDSAEKEKAVRAEEAALLKQDLIKAFDAVGEKNLSFMEKLGNHLQEGQDKQQNAMRTQLQQMEQRLQGMEHSVEERLESIRTSNRESISAMQSENSKKLEEIRNTVDEKLQSTLEKRLTESFQTVSNQLEMVYKGLGEMQTLAGDVGGLKKILSGVKTRGILGEIQLGAILEEILSPEQYETNVATVPGSTERVEFAIKMPSEQGNVYLPIDSKFPGDRYMQLTEAQELGDKTAVAEAKKALSAVLKAEAKDIHQKYVSVPYTTNFAVMFLPFEGLYAEAVNSGLLEYLQREYQVCIAGPSTMAALLNSLQMGFRTLAIQKRSNEVWELLGAVKTEFEKFHGVLDAMHRHLDQTNQDLENLMGTRTNVILRKLRGVQQLDGEASNKILELDE